ncbi:hypothetical protein HanIR_Chr05g0225211 [Helianthus annuus]|nr:hypothetical protein HanIR_Chr05g0225211 [Helianthus annuus]
MLAGWVRMLSVGRWFGLTQQQLTDLLSLINYKSLGPHILGHTLPGRVVEHVIASFDYVKPLTKPLVVLGVL